MYDEKVSVVRDIKQKVSISIAMNAKKKELIHIFMVVSPYFSFFLSQESVWNNNAWNLKRYCRQLRPLYVHMYMSLRTEELVRFVTFTTK